MTAASFASLGASADVVARLAARGITEPFPIQAATLPDALAGRDIAGRAPTGSGKTIAFGIPMVTRVRRARPGRPRGLVLVPTRELATQVTVELRQLAGRNTSVMEVYGGVAFGPQVTRLRRGTDIVVACPGRLADLIRRGHLVLDDVDTVAIDEADRMADMGFLPEVRRILDAVSPERQTLLFSATLDGDVDVLVKRYQRSPVRHDVVPEETTITNSLHLFWRTDRGERVRVLADVVNATSPAVVFCRTKHGADRLAKQLERAGVSAAAIHGDRSQSQRNRALAAFTDGEVQALVATDVAARGIHVDDVAVVVHYDPPGTHKDYVHRSGRTARAGQSGVVVSFVDNDQHRAAKALQRELGLDVGVSAVDVSAVGTSQPQSRPQARAPRPPRPERTASSGPRRPARGKAQSGGRRRVRSSD